MSITLDRLRQLLGSGGIIAIAVVVMNLSTYGFQMIAARLVGPAQFGSIASLLAISLVASVLMLGLQATAARRIAASPEEVDEVEHAILALGWRASLAVALLLVALSPLVEHLLHLRSVYPALLLAAGTLPMNVMGTQAGILQGERRWRELAVVYLAAGVPRVVIGVVALAVRPTEGSAMAAVTLGWIAPCAVGWWFLTRGRQARVRRLGRPVALRAVSTEVAHSSLALLGFFALANVDILMSRHVLTTHASGLYAGGLIMTKAVQFLPQFVSIVAFPAMSTPRERRTAMLRSLAVIGVVGAVAVAGSILLSGLAMTFVGGAEYAPIEGRLWLFAIIGTLLSALQLLVYSVLARQSRRSTWLLWAAVVVVVAVGWWQVDTMDDVLELVVLTDGALFAALLGLSLWTMRGDATGATAPTDGAGASVGGVVPAAAGADAHVERHP
ncbi:MAG: oligosaccharide flippase family protein [Nocardioides sp.]|uniref:lipopolysaccharide biosynthesis protein n=1 Tax=Nocardioides sp. TaxID=35761 RepID=UPI0039E43458